MLLFAPTQGLAADEARSSDQAAGEPTGEHAHGSNSSVARWLVPQAWRRDTAGPILSLGDPGAFDDTHIFAPLVMRQEQRYWMWYCGSRGQVGERVFSMGLATSRDGRNFMRYRDRPVLALEDRRHSVLTPTLLRSADGAVLRHEGKLRLWFSSTWFQGGKGLHTLHETSSQNGVDWQPPSGSQLEHAYAPSILKIGATYHMWYTDVSLPHWAIRYASSNDGQNWRVANQPVLQLDQDWERDRLIYPTVLMVDDVYLMWYGSYWSARASTTAIGLAVSLDGKAWQKNPHNPVLRPDPARPWESHYVTSQSIHYQADGSFRIWYASRKAPPFVNKYFALNTAVWDPTQEHSESSCP